MFLSLLDVLSILLFSFQMAAIMSKSLHSSLDSSYILNPTFLVIPLAHIPSLYTAPSTPVTSYIPHSWLYRWPTYQVFTQLHRLQLHLISHIPGSTAGPHITSKIFLSHIFGPFISISVPVHVSLLSKRS